MFKYLNTVIMLILLVGCSSESSSINEGPADSVVTLNGLHEEANYDVNFDYNLQNYPASYTLSFDTKFATTPNFSQTITTENAVVFPDIPQRNNYLFNGWWNGLKRYDFTADLSRDLTISASWISTSNKYINGGNLRLNDKRKVTFNELNTTIYYLWSPITTDVTIETSNLKNSTSSPADPEMLLFYINSNNIFGLAPLKNYLKDINSPAGNYNAKIDLTLSANLSYYLVIYSNDKYHIGEADLSVNSSEDIPPFGRAKSLNISPIQTQRVTNLVGLKYPGIPVRADGLLFGGWYEKNVSIQYDFSKSITKDTTLFAKWFENLSFELKKEDGGKALGPEIKITLKKGSTFTLPTPANDSKFTFEGWFLQRYSNGERITDESGKSLVPWEKSGNFTLYPGLLPQEYSITFFTKEESPIGIEKIQNDSYSMGYLTTDGRLYMWGNNLYGTVGDGTNLNKNSPVEITSFFNLSEEENLVDFVLYSSTVVALSNQNRIFTWGKLNSNSQNNKPIDITANFDLGEDEFIKKISPNYFLSTKGRLFFSNAGLYANTFEISDITSRFDLRSEIITDYDAFLYSGIISTSRKRIHTFSYNATPTIVNNSFNFESSEVPIKLIIETSSATPSYGVLSSLGNLYFWGNNYHGQLGTGTTSNVIDPTKIESKWFNLSAGERVIDFSLDFLGAGALTSTGKLYLWGSNSEGQVGHDSSTSVKRPSLLTSLSLQEDDFISSFSRINSSTIITTSKNKIYVFGKNALGLFFNESIEKSSTPIEITSYFDDIIDSDSITVNNSVNYSRDYFYSLITKNNKVYVWGDVANKLLIEGRVSEATVIVSETDYSLFERREAIKYNYFIDNLYPSNRSGYRFDGWYMDESMTFLFDKKYMPDRNIVLYGKWIKL